MLWPRKPSLVVLVVCVGCWVLPSVALATTTHYPFWTFTSKNGAVLPPGDSSTVSFSLQTSYNGKNTPIAGGTYLVHPGDSAQTMATNLAEQLNASTQNAYWQFTVVQDAKVPSRWNVQGNLVTMAAITVPEPTTIVLAALGALGLLEFRRRAKATVLSQQHSGHQGATRRP